MAGMKNYLVSWFQVFGQVGTRIANVLQNPLEFPMLALLFQLACINSPTVLQVGTVYDAPCPPSAQECDERVFAQCDSVNEDTGLERFDECEELVEISHCAQGFRFEHEYLFCNELLPREEASEFCRSIGMTLVVVSDEHESQWIADVADEHLYGNPWLGLVRSRGSGRWFWENGEALDYTEWSDFEPNNSGDNESCVEMYLDNILESQFGQWNDTPCTQLRNPICETW